MKHESLGSGLMKTLCYKLGVVEITMNLVWARTRKNLKVKYGQVAVAATVYIGPGDCNGLLKCIDITRRFTIIQSKYGLVGRVID